MLIVQRGKELGYKLNDEQFKTVLDNIKKENKLETEEQFEAALKQENMTMPELRRNLEKSMIIQKVQQNEVVTKVGVTEEEARKYYEGHRTEFTSPRHAARDSRDGSTNGRGQRGAGRGAEKKADKIRARLVAGEASTGCHRGPDAPSKANAGSSVRSA